LSDSYGALRYRINPILAIALIIVNEAQDNGFWAIPTERFAIALTQY